MNTSMALDPSELLRVVGTDLKTLLNLVEARKRDGLQVEAIVLPLPKIRIFGLPVVFEDVVSPTIVTKKR